MTQRRYRNVWAAIEDTPQAAENLRLRSLVMRALQRRIERSESNLAQGAQLLGVSEARVDELMRGKIDLFSLTALVDMATAAGLRIEMQISEPSSVNSLLPVDGAGE